jgi:Holliday junction DNA helicase RuvB
MTEKLTPANPIDEVSIDVTLRPSSWGEYVGQEKIKDNLKIIIQAAKGREEAMDHVLLAGPAGLGKTTLAHLVAKEMGVGITTTSGPALEKMGDMAAILTNLEPRQILFIDEAHRVNHLVEEVLYPAMEARKLHLVIGKGPSARTVSLDLPPFTILAATTRENLLSQPLRSRFGATLRLEYYAPEDIKAILTRSSKILGIHADKDAVEILSKAARATPRIANRLLRRARDYAQVNNIKTVNAEAAKKTLEMLDIDELGLEPNDRKLLSIIIQKFNGGPVGVGTLAAALHEERGVIEDIYEPYLMSLGFLQRTSAGRIALPPAYAHLGHRKTGELL